MEEGQDLEQKTQIINEETPKSSNAHNFRWFVDKVRSLPDVLRRPTPDLDNNQKLRGNFETALVRLNQPKPEVIDSQYQEMKWKSLGLIEETWQGNLHTEYMRQNFPLLVKGVIRHADTDQIAALFSKVNEFVNNDDPSLRAMAIPTIPFFLNNEGFRNNNRQVEPAKELFFTTIQKFGLDPKAVINAWVDSFSLTGMEEHSTFYKERNLVYWERMIDKFSLNLETMARLESQTEGLCKTLNEEFGIYDFGRYPESILLEQYQQRDFDVPYGVIVYPREDHNGAFYQDKDIFEKLNSQLENSYSMRILEAGDRNELIRRLVQLSRRYNKKINFGILGGHGEPESLLLGRDHPLRSSDYSIDDYYLKSVFGKDFIDENPQLNTERPVQLTLADIQRSVTGGLIERFFEPSATLILAACSTGKAAEDIHRDIRGRQKGINKVGRKTYEYKREKIGERKFFAESVADAGANNGLRVIAPDIPAHFESIDVNIGTDKIPVFTVHYQQDDIVKEYGKIPSQE